MTLRRWIVEWLQDSPAAPVVEGIDDLFQTLFGGVIGANHVAEETVDVAPETIDLVLSVRLTLVYIGVVIAILFLGMNILTCLKERVTDTRLATRTKGLVAIGIWIVLTAVDTMVRGELFVHEMTRENAEWIYVVRQM